MRIYLESTDIAIKAEEECNNEARKMGFKDWWSWHEHERLDSSMSIRDLSSYVFMMGVTRKYRDMEERDGDK